MKLKGTLEIERRTIRILLIVSIAAMTASAFLEYGQGNIIPQKWYDLLHAAFLTNVMLGIAGSSVISMFCLLHPYITKKKILTSQILLLVKKVYGDHEQIRYIILRNSQRDRSERNYFGEISLAKAIQRFEDSICSLTNEYRKAEFTTENIDQIVAIANEQMLSVVQLIDNFLQTMVPTEYCMNPVEVPTTIEKKYFDPEENKELYLLLDRAIEQIISCREVEQLFGKYISKLEVTNDMLSENISDLQNRLDQCIYDNKILTIQLKLNSDVVKVRRKHETNWSEQQDELTKRRAAIVKKLSTCPKEEQELYYKKLNEAYDAFDKEGYAFVDQKLRELEQVLEIHV